MIDHLCLLHKSIMKHTFLKKFLICATFISMLFLTQNLAVFAFDFDSEYEKIDFKSNYDYVGFFSEGLAAVTVKASGKMGYINKMGKLVIEPKYTAVQSFHEGVAWVQYGEFPNSKVTLIDKTGRELFTPTSKIDFAYEFNEGLAVVYTGASRHQSAQTVDGGQYIFVDKKGNQVFPKKYDAVRSFSEGFAVVNVGAGWEEEGGKWEMGIY